MCARVARSGEGSKMRKRSIYEISHWVVEELSSFPEEMLASFGNRSPFFWSCSCVHSTSFMRTLSRDVVSWSWLARRAEFSSLTSLSLCELSSRSAYGLVVGSSKAKSARVCSNSSRNAGFSSPLADSSVWANSSTFSTSPWVVI